MTLAHRYGDPASKCESCIPEAHSGLEQQANLKLKMKLKKIIHIDLMEYLQECLNLILSPNTNQKTARNSDEATKHTTELSCLLKEQLLEPALNLTVHCCGREFRVLNGYDHKSFAKKEGLELISDIFPCGNLPTTTFTKDSTRMVSTKTKIKDSFYSQGTVVVFLFENLCPVRICLSGFLDALDFSTGMYLFFVLWDFASLFCAEARGFNLERKAFVSYVLLSEHLRFETRLLIDASNIQVLVLQPLAIVV
ncbi:hypothetical protein Tco_0707444 [Tanacetum coccineum]|uniref:Uncharacterized protein n=1 Tax=Tanacetum coccineum TaxID=301880 RepID=A0ABQ4YBR5_9ASTR